jgi:hypothetical protein
VHLLLLLLHLLLLLLHLLLLLWRSAWHLHSDVLAWNCARGHLDLHHLTARCLELCCEMMRIVRVYDDSIRVQYENSMRTV